MLIHVHFEQLRPTTHTQTHTWFINQSSPRVGPLESKTPEILC